MKRLILLALATVILSGCDNAMSLDGVYFCNSKEADKPFAYSMAITNHGAFLYDDGLRYTPSPFDKEDGYVSYSHYFKADGSSSTVNVKSSFLHGVEIEDVGGSEIHHLSCKKLTK
ncbi:membrane lipoprotein lipid attachment site-containing protein [Citrobacter portucalensis]|uniref:membrane lipoprotein lipid attachment site-containing protein n=1 Tax=Citrobacter portucalensis TaxID=1639133 RepID=UPI003BF59649